MDNEVLKENFKAFCCEVYKFSDEERDAIFKMIENVSGISTISNTDKEIIELCKKVYNILCDHDLWRVFIRILMNEKKFGYYRLIVTDGHDFYNGYIGINSSE